MHFDEKQLFIIDYLDSEDPKMRDTAANILAELIMYQRPMRLSAVTKYLSDEYPFNVRVVALVHSLCFHFAGCENPTMEERRALREEMKEPWSELLNEVAERAGETPHFDILAYRIGFLKQPANLLKPENVPLMVRKILALERGECKQGKRPLITLMDRFPADIVATELLQWYPTVENRDVRAEVVCHIESRRRGMARIDLLKLKPVIKLAAEDKDEEIAKKAEALLEKMEE
jgi:hypothetical protein